MAQASAAPEAAAKTVNASALRTEIHYDIAGVEALEPDWRALFTASATGNYFVSYDWCWSWLHAFGTGASSRPVVMTVRHDGQLVALLPLMMRRFGPIKVAEPIGRDSGQYCDLLMMPHGASQPDIFRALWDGIAKAGIDLLQFVNVRDDSPLADFLTARRTIQSAPIHSCALDTTKFANFEAYLGTRSSSLRKNMRRRRRRLEDLGPVRFEVVTDPTDIDEIAGVMVGHKLGWLENRRWHGRFLSRKGVASWLGDISRRALASGQLHLSLLRVGDQVASAQLGFICGGRLTAYLSSFDMAYSNYAVGRMQYAAFIEDVFDQGLNIDLMPRHEEFKLEWVDRGVATRGYAVPVTILGSVAALVQNPRNRAAARRAINFVDITFLSRLRRPASSVPVVVSEGDTTEQKPQLPN